MALLCHGLSCTYVACAYSHKSPEASETEAVNTVPYHGETYSQTKPVEITVADEAIVPNSHLNVIHKYTGTLSYVWIMVASVKLVWLLGSVEDECKYALLKVTTSPILPSSTSAFARRVAGR